MPAVYRFSEKCTQVFCELPHRGCNIQLNYKSHPFVCYPTRIDLILYISFSPAKHFLWAQAFSSVNLLVKGSKSTNYVEFPTELLTAHPPLSVSNIPLPTTKCLSYPEGNFEPSRRETITFHFTNISSLLFSLRKFRRCLYKEMTETSLKMNFFTIFQYQI